MRILPKYRFIIILLVNAIIFIIAAHILPIRFEENDDIIMCMIANGSYSGSPDNHLVFINAIYGSLLVLLYSIFPYIEWYTLCFSFFHIISISLLVFYMFESYYNNYYKSEGLFLTFLWLSFFYIIWFKLIISFQFTTTAGLMTVVGCFLLYKKTNISLFIGGGLIFIASLIRFNIVGLVVLLFIPFFLYYIPLKSKSFLFIIIVGVMCICAKYSDNLFYQSQDWLYYKTYNEIRGKINDNPNASNSLVFESLPDGITSNDYKLLLNFIPDVSVITLDVIKEIHNTIDSLKYEQGLQNVYNLRTYALVISLLGFITLILTVSKRKSLILITYILFLSLCAFISLDMTLKNRVFLSMLLAIMLMFYESSIVNINKRYNFKFLFLCLSLVIMIMNLKYMKQINNTRQSTIVKIERWNDTINLLSKLPKKSLILQIGGVMPLEGIDPFRVNIANIKLIMLGWLTNIPFDINYYNSHLDVTKDNIYCYTKNCPYNEMIDNPFFSSLRERYKKDIYYESLYSKSNHQIIKVIKKIKN